jgi:potassium-dependent mechanosensitive channel
MRKRIAIWLLTGLFCGGTKAATQPGPPATNHPATAAAATNAAAIPSAEIATQGESASAALQNIAAELSLDKTTPTIQQNLPALTDEISARLEENSKVLARTPSLELLRRLGSEWQDIREQLSTWKRDLGKRATHLDEEISWLSQLDKTWDLTRAAGEKAKLPAEVTNEVETVITGIKQTRDKLEGQQAVILTLQNRVAEQDARVSQSLSAIEHSLEEIMGHLFVRDSAPIWSPELRSSSAQDLEHQGRRSLARQWLALQAYAQRKSARFFTQGAIFLVLAALIFWARRRFRNPGEKDSELRHATLVFDVPIATALVLALVFSSWIYPQAPRLLWAILGAIAIIPSVIVLRRLVRPSLFPVLNLLVVFYFIDELRSVAAAPELLSRGLFLCEMLCGILFLSWFLKCRLAAERWDDRWRKILRGAIGSALVLFTAAFCANAIGYAAFSKLLGNATLTSAYLALILYAVVRIADGLILSALSVRPLNTLAMVRRHRPFLQNRTRQLLEWALLALWVIYVLEAFSLRAPVFQDLKEILTAKLTLGSVTFSLGAILLFAGTIWIAFMVSRISRFILEEEVYPHVHLAPGIHYSISRMVHYAILLAGFLVAIALLGFNMTRLTILVGAVGVGLGFGLQNIINNFVSGIILLFERPIKVGDVVQLGDTEGVVTHIGIRASIIRTTNGPEIVMPNGKLISDPVTNWTFSRRRRMITIPLSIVPGTDAARVLAILQTAAGGQSALLNEPPAQSLFVGISGGALNFELRVWTDQINDWMQIRSDLYAKINAALIGQNISIK